MSVTFCIDFGNTRKKLAVFQGSEFREAFVLPDDRVSTLQPYIDRYRPDKSILSSVIDHDPLLDEQLTAGTRFHRLSHLTRIPFTTPVGKPETIGADRLALCAAAVHFYPGFHNLVIGLGTCITYNFINKYHEFLGGGISPGLEMRLKALQYYTAKLPLVAADSNAPLIGYDTATNILSGVVLGMA
ncbi:MAG: hypothetical protein RJA57_644, partial [Bacteroidota bacterium]